MKKLIITLLALTSILINPVLASELSTVENSELIALQEYQMPNLFEEGMKSLSEQADLQVHKITWTMTAKLDLDLAQQDQTDQVLEKLKQEHHQYLLTHMQNTAANASN